MLAERRRAILVFVSLGVLYTVWGSTYLAQRVAVSSFPPLQMMALRFLVAGGLLFGWLRARGTPAPTPAQWRAAALSALPLLVTGMGAAAVGIKRVPSGLAALMFGSVPLWTSLVDRLWGGQLRRAEVLGLFAGFAGVALVSLRGGLSGDPAGALILLGAAASYSLGAVATRRLPLSPGIQGTASQMLAGGAMLMGLSLAAGERFSTPTPRAAFALGYVTVLGSLVAYVAFGYLLRTVRPALATSYAFVNPIVALALGALLAGERVTAVDLLGLLLVLSAVGMVALGSARAPRRAEAADVLPRLPPQETGELCSAPISRRR